MSAGDGSEMILIRTTDGPDPGTHVVPLGMFEGWPPPESLSGSKPGGVYRRVSYSELPACPPDAHIMRGAAYEWKEDA